MSSVSDFSIIIPHRGSTMGLWATLSACDSQLKNSQYSYKYYILSNGDEKESDDLKFTIDFLNKSGKLGYYEFLKDPISPPNARAYCVDKSDGEYLFFFDNHCVPDLKYFEYVEKCMLDDECDILHSATTFFAGQPACYEYRLKLKYNFWGESTYTPKYVYKKYQIAASGHGGFVCKRSVWDYLGGYGPTSLLSGYGGEEMIFDLKAWRFGKKVWIHPKINHYHYAGVRGYNRHYSADYYTNLLISALVIGGEKWFNTLYENFLTDKHLKTFNHKDNMFSIYQEAYNRGIEYSKFVDKKSKYSLDELLSDYFVTNEVSY